MLSDVDKEMLREHVEQKRRRCTQNTDKLRHNAIKYANGLGATRDEIVKNLHDLGLPTTDEEVEKILGD